MPAVMRAAFGCLVLLLVCVGTTTLAEQALDQTPPNLELVMKEVRETIRREYARPARFTYLEHSRDIDVSRLGKVSVGPLRTFEVYPDPIGDTYKRLIAIEGKPLDPAELARRDAEHERDLHKRASESPRQRAARHKREQEEAREREAILDDAKAVFEPSFICRELLDGQPVIVLALKPRPGAQTTTREGGWMKQVTGKMWVSEADKSIARLRLHAIDHLSVGWGVVARVEPGSGFDYVRKRISDAWLPSELTVQASGRTLLFRRFEVKAVTTYSGHQPNQQRP
jgi:hypothetical protein